LRPLERKIPGSPALSTVVVFGLRKRSHSEATIVSAFVSSSSFMVHFVVSPVNYITFSSRERQAYS